MPHSLPEKQIEQLAASIAAYIDEQREAFRAEARPIATEHIKVVQPFFPGDVFHSVLVVRGRAPKPSFYSQLKALGIRNAPAFSDMAGITFQDVVVHVEPLSIGLLFHELVHAVQYKHLGLQGFADAYVRGFLSGGSYEEIPLEKQAYELEGRFSGDQAHQFSVEDDVKTRVRTKAF